MPKIKKICCLLIACLCFYFLDVSAQGVNVIAPSKKATPTTPDKHRKTGGQTTVKIGKKRKDKEKSNTPTQTTSQKPKPKPVPKPTPSPKPSTTTKPAPTPTPKPKPKPPTSGWLDGYEWVDLGLPSGTLWAKCNVGAARPEEYGYYFGFNEAIPYDPDGVRYGTITNRVIGDAASEYWGDNWETPDLEQFEELNKYCTFRWENRNGTYGVKVSGKNGASIFMPAAGTLLIDGIIEIDEVGTYWSSTREDMGRNREGYLLSFVDGGQALDWEYLYCGLSVRPVVAVDVDFDDDDDY